MSPRIPQDELPYDEHGYREYGVMLHVSGSQIRLLRKFHEAIGLSDFSTLAHVSVNNFDLPQDLGEVMARLSLIATKTRPFRVQLDPDGAKPWGDGSSGSFSVVESQALVELHRAIRDGAARPDNEAAAASRPEVHATSCCLPFTAYLAATAEEAECAKRLLPKLDLGAGYVARSVELSARRGPARGGNYTVLASFPFSLRIGPESPPL